MYNNNNKKNPDYSASFQRNQFSQWNFKCYNRFIGVVINMGKQDALFPLEILQKQLLALPAGEWLD